ncbi:hypothetical protein [Novosphingobium sp.]|uniref:hypothetical protein n=1 Tax=Novosphingobium sp. TaxID=1874826 RepID=UPI003BABB066
MATIPDPNPDPPEVPLPDPDDHPERDEPIEPRMAPPGADPLPPETVNQSQEDEDAQSQTLAAASSGRDAADFVLEDSDKTPAQDEEDDVQDLVDHMHDMVRSGRIDMDAYRGERNDDDEDGMFGPGGEDD